MFTLVYLCFPFTRVYLCLVFLTYVYPFIRVYVFIRFYLSLLISSYIKHCLLEPVYLCLAPITRFDLYLH